MKKLFAGLDRRAWIIFLIVFVDLLGFGIILPFLPYYVESLGAGPIAVGGLLSAYSLFQFLAAPILGELSDRYGRRPILIFSMAGTAFSFFLMGSTEILWLIFLARIIDGASGGNISTAQAYMADITSKERRTQGMGLLAAAFSLGFILGPAAGGILSRFGYAVPAFVAGAVSLIAMLLTVFYLPESRQPGKSALPAKKKGLFRFRDFYDVVMLPKVGLVIVIAFFVMFAFALMQGTFVLLTADELHMTAEQNGYIFTYVGAVGIILQLFLLKRILAWLTERQAAALGIFSMAIGFGVMVFTNNLALLLLAVTGMAFGNGVSQPVLMGLVSKFSPEDEQGNIMGIFQSTGSIARLIGPVTGGLIYGFHHRWPYVFSSAILAATALLAGRFLHSAKAASSVKRSAPEHFSH